MSEILWKYAGFETVRFAGPLKAMLFPIFEALTNDPGKADQMLDGDLKGTQVPLLEKTPREMMQTLGTEWGRNCVQDDLWIKLAGVVAAQKLYHGQAVVFDDMRFKNEFDFIKKAGGMTVKIVRPDAEKPNGHVSEGQLDDEDFDVVIVNDGTLEHLEHMVDHQILKAGN